MDRAESTEHILYYTMTRKKLKNFINNLITATKKGHIVWESEIAEDCIITSTSIWIKNYETIFSIKAYYAREGFDEYELFFSIVQTKRITIVKHIVIKDVYSLNSKLILRRLKELSKCLEPFNDAIGTMNSFVNVIEMYGDKSYE